MKPLGDRLARSLSPPASRGLSSELEQVLPSLDASSPGRHGLSTCCPGQEVSNAEGSYWLIRSRYDLSHKHGERVLGCLLDREMSRLSTLTGDTRLSSPKAQRALFLDLSLIHI